MAFEICCPVVLFSLSEICITIAVRLNVFVLINIHICKYMYIQLHLYNRIIFQRMKTV